MRLGSEERAIQQGPSLADYVTSREEFAEGALLEWATLTIAWGLVKYVLLVQKLSCCS